MSKDGCDFFFYAKMIPDLLTVKYKGVVMIKVTTYSGTQYIIDEENNKIKRIPRPGTELDSMLRGFINVGEFQPYRDIEGIEIDKSLIVKYSNEQNWSYSTAIKEIDYGYEESLVE